MNADRRFSANDSTLLLALVPIGAAVLLPLVFGSAAVLYSAFRGPTEADDGHWVGVGASRRRAQSPQ